MAQIKYEDLTNDQLKAEAKTLGTALTHIQLSLRALRIIQRSRKNGK